MSLDLEFMQYGCPKVMAVANQKGGVGKTTTTINLGAAMADRGLRVLIVDLDPQGNASTGLGVDERTYTTYDLLLDDVDVSKLIQKCGIENLHIIPANTDLSSADMELLANERRSLLLRDALAKVKDLGYDVVLIDCPPSLNLLTINAFIAANSVLVPLQSEFYALEGLSQLMLTIREVRQAGNPDLRIEGVVLTMYDNRNNLSQQVQQDARDNLGELVFDTLIPRNVRLSEAPSFAMPVLSYDPYSKGAKAYWALADEIMKKNKFEVA